MIFWDSSAVVPLLINQANSDRSFKLYEEDDRIIVWWGTSIECISAISRGERMNSLDSSVIENALISLNALRSAWREISPSKKIKQIAERLLRVHSLTAADAMQLAACILASSEYSINFLCYDQQLVSAAKKEGIVCL